MKVYFILHFLTDFIGFIIVKVFLFVRVGFLMNEVSLHKQILMIEVILHV